jgi:hypothetical protein
MHRLLTAVDEKLTTMWTMWWPRIEYVNTAEQTITNQSLEVFPSGHVKYTVGLTSTFRAGLDLRRFPFDTQTLSIRLQSLLYDAERVRLVPAPRPPCCSRSRMSRSSAGLILR